MPKIVKPMNPHQESLHKLLCGANSDDLNIFKLSCNVDDITWSKRRRSVGVVYEAKLWKEGECKYVVSYYVNTWDYVTTYSITILNLKTKTSINSEYGSVYSKDIKYDKFREQFKSVTSLDPFLFQ